MSKREFFVSDLHFGHKKEFIFKDRGFENTFEHDEYVIKKWNEIIDFDDDVYVLGDLAMNDVDYAISQLKRLNGRLHIVIGNHDTDNKIERYRELYNVVEIEYAIRLKRKGYSLFLTHFPNLIGKDTKRSVWNICGHTHEKNMWIADTEKVNCPALNVALDANNNIPVSLEEVIKRIEKKKETIAKNKQ